jgi:hypothetical protein
LSVCLDVYLSIYIYSQVVHFFSATKITGGQPLGVSSCTPQELCHDDATAISAISAVSGAVNQSLREGFFGQTERQLATLFKDLNSQKGCVGFSGLATPGPVSNVVNLRTTWTFVVEKIFVTGLITRGYLQHSHSRENMMINHPSLGSPLFLDKPKCFPKSL